MSQRAVWGNTETELYRKSLGIQHQARKLCETHKLCNTMSWISVNGLIDICICSRDIATSVRYKYGIFSQYVLHFLYDAIVIMSVGMTTFTFIENASHTILQYDALLRIEWHHDYPIWI
ncbi:hypothetical protein CDAR_378281 [Caerostris darwini]|uniref:Uncharacterized protein n=1 Tax=Caerostris darwini TaxID=1538125 RepID=A0AAV4TA74_9ARAC|nr:hypothetical protein CDAR_378281 [Caerostris darwini]